MSLFNYEDYREYLGKILPVKGPERGGRSRLAQHLNCQLAFVSLVIGGRAHFSLEHAILVTEFLGLSREESEYFLLLVQRGRAGSKKLREYFQKKIDSSRSERTRLASRLENVESALNTQDSQVYYSHWIYTALHMALLVPELKSREQLQRYLGVSPKRLNEAIAFLVRTGIAQEKGNGLTIGPTRLHLGADSPLLSKHHINWRMQAIASLDEPREQDLHYSSIFSASHEAVEEIREQIVRLITRADRVIKPSKDETVQSLCVDFFSVGKRND